MTYRFKGSTASWCASLGLLALSVSAQQPVFETYGTINASMQGATTGPDGNLWVCAAGFMVKITPDGIITQYTLDNDVLNVPEEIVTGPDGNLWFTDSGAHSIGKITPDGVYTKYPLSPFRFDSGPQGIARGSDGNLWFAESGNFKIGRITTGGLITEYTVQSEPFDITAGPDGNMWFTNIGAGAIDKLTLDGASFTAYATSSNSEPTSIAVGPDGNLWFLERAINKIGKMTLSGVLTEYPIPTPESLPWTITSGPDGNLWFTENSGNKLGRISTDGTITEYTIPNSYAPSGVATGPDHNLWITDANGGQVYQLLMASFSIASSQTSLPFSYQQGGGNPPEQAIDVSGIGGASVPINVSATSTGNWLHVTSDSAVTPATLTISVDPSSLQPDTYRGAVSVALSNGFALPIKVVLTVTPNPNIQISLGSLSFAYQSGGGLLASQLVEVTALSGGSVPFTASISSPGNWLSVTPTSGMTPASLTISANPVSLAPGVYTGTLTIMGGSGSNTVTIFVTFAVNANSTVVVSVSSLGFVYQTGSAPPPLQSVQVTGFNGGAVAFTASAASKGNWLSVTPTSGVTPSSLMVAVNPAGLAMGIYPGTVTVAGSSGTNASTIAILLSVTAPPNPTVTSIVNGASFAAGGISPGEIVTLIGNSMGPTTALGAVSADGKISSQLGGVTVSFNNFAAPILYASATQINCVAPYEIAKLSNVSVKVNYLGQSSTLYPVNVVGVAPAIFQGAVLNQSGSLNTAENPAAVGSVVVFWMTGEGQTNPLGLTGRITEINNSSTGPLTPQPLITPTVTIGGQAAKVHFYGEAPDLVSGILQINVEVPAGLPAGSWPLVVSFGPISSQGGITVAVQ